MASGYNELRASNEALSNAARNYEMKISDLSAELKKVDIK